LAGVLSLAFAIASLEPALAEDEDCQGQRQCDQYERRCQILTEEFAHDYSLLLQQAPLTQQRPRHARGSFLAQLQIADVVAGFKNKLQVAMAGITPKEVLAEQHRKMAQPGTAKN
jgi:hypothetical protein